MPAGWVSFSPHSGFVLPWVGFILGLVLCTWRILQLQAMPYQLSNRRSEENTSLLRVPAKGPRSLGWADMGQVSFLEPITMDGGELDQGISARTDTPSGCCEQVQPHWNHL